MASFSGNRATPFSNGVKAPASRVRSVKAFARGRDVDAKVKHLF